MKTLKHILMGCVLVGVVSLLTGCTKEPPKADFSYMYGEIEGEVIFINRSENCYYYQWDFGDGTTSTEKNPVHVYDISTRHHGYAATLMVYTRKRDAYDICTQQTGI